jgi:hypothetical protein
MKGRKFSGKIVLDRKPMQLFSSWRRCAVQEAQIFWIKCFLSSAPLTVYLLFLCKEGPRSRCYGRTAALRLIVQPLWWRWREIWSVFLFLQVMEHRWNETDSGKPKYSGNRAALSTTNSTESEPGIEPGPQRWEAGD